MVGDFKPKVSSNIALSNIQAISLGIERFELKKFSDINVEVLPQGLIRIC